MKDKRISQLFDDYADQLPQQNSLADKAVAKMQAVNKRKKSSNFLVKFGGFCAVVLVCVICLSIFLPMFGGDKNDGAQDPSQTPYRVYADSDLFGVRVGATSELNSALHGSYADVKTLFCMDEVTDLYGKNDISKAKYVAYYLSDNKTLANVTATYRVYDRTVAAFCDVIVVAECDGLVQNVFQRRYDYPDNYLSNYLSENGEYVAETKYQGQYNMHFYVFGYGSNPQAVIAACTAVSEILQKV